MRNVSIARKCLWRVVEKSLQVNTTVCFPTVCRYQLCYRFPFHFLPVLPLPLCYPPFPCPHFLCFLLSLFRLGDFAERLSSRNGPGRTRLSSALLRMLGWKEWLLSLTCRVESLRSLVCPSVCSSHRGTMIIFFGWNKLRPRLFPCV